jgi:hypothetical protein
MAALKVKAASETSASLIEAVMGKTDTGDVQAGNRRLIVTLLQESLLKGAAEGEIKLGDIYKASRTMESVANTELRDQQIKENERKRLAAIAAEEMKKLQATAAKKGTITDEEIAEAGKTIFG